MGECNWPSGSRNYFPGYIATEGTDSWVHPHAPIFLCSLTRGGDNSILFQKTQHNSDVSRPSRENVKTSVSFVK
jgi:hypothetical protein